MSKCFLVACFVAACTMCGLAQHIQADAAHRLGKVSFSTSCSANVQPQLERAVALLHSFEYVQSLDAFQQVAQQDPNCAMAYWGEAMSLYHELWDSPSAKDLAEGWKLAQKAQATTPKTPREVGYIQAILAFYKPGQKDTETRATAYSQQMEQVYKSYPSDENAATFYALSLLASEPNTDTSLSYAMKAAGILKPIFEKDPDNPGAAHYLIHACDNPKMAKEGLAAAKRYASIAPGSPHALHMPSHIFARLGLWQDDIASNLASVAAAEHVPAGAASKLHAMDFLEYAYLQTGQDEKAREMVKEAVATKNEGFPRGQDGYYFYAQAHFPALLALETRDWKAAESLQPTPGAEPGFQAITYWAQAVGAGHLHDAAAAATAVHKLDDALAASRKLHPNNPVPPVVTNQDEAHAWLAFSKGDSAAAFKLLQPVIEFQDSVGKGEVELPAREMYADMLLEVNRPSEALEQYRLSLKSDPARFNGLYGAGRAAELAHQPEVASNYYKQLLDNCAHDKGPVRPELQYARKFLAENGVRAAR